MSTEEQLSTDVKFDGKIVRVRVDAVRLPGGREATREVVEHAASVVVVPVDADRNVLLVRQFRYPVGHSPLEAPAGGVETGESPDDSAQRELQEETGYASRDLLTLGGFWMSPGSCTEYMHAYLARELVPSQLNPRLGRKHHGRTGPDRARQEARPVGRDRGRPDSRRALHSHADAGWLSRSINAGGCPTNEGSEEEQT